MRQVVLDTETTGFEVSDGNRIVEIGCTELLERRPSGRYYHQYLNPDRESEPGALRVHGLTTEFLSDKPRFEDVVDEFIQFVSGAELLIHNAAFDVRFLDAEIARCAPHYGRLSDHVAGIVDTLAMAKTLYPGQRNSLDALCKRLGIDNTHRELHGALLDAELLLEVYIAMTSGQFDLALESAEKERLLTDTPMIAATQCEVLVLRADSSELEAHHARLAALEKASGVRLWPNSEAS